MNKDWDKVLPPKQAFQEIYRVLKHGALAFVMSSPRQDLLWRMMSLLESVGFELKQSPIYWTFASGFPKAMDVAKNIDKKLGVQRKVVGIKTLDIGMQGGQMHSNRPVNVIEVPNDVATSELAVKWDGWKSQTGLKPAVEVILMVNKPRLERTIVDNVLKHGTGAINVDACRIPLKPNDKSAHYGGLHESPTGYSGGFSEGYKTQEHRNGRFPANLLVSDDVLDTGKTTKSGKLEPHHIITSDKTNEVYGKYARVPAEAHPSYGDEGGFSRFFSLDAWWRERIKKLPVEVQRTFPFLITPKAPKSERNEGLEKHQFSKQIGHNLWDKCRICGGFIINKGKRPNGCVCEIPTRENNTINGNFHPTVKPLKLMSYLVTLGCPLNGVILDPFVGSGTTLVASWLMRKSGIGIDINAEYCGIADAKMRYFTKTRTPQTSLSPIDYTFKNGLGIDKEIER